MALLTGRRVFRVCRARYGRLDGIGARLVGGRWNSSGRAIVYMAATLPEGIGVVHEKDLRKHPALQDVSTQQLGDWWLDSQTSAVLQMPSFVIVGEHNFLLNPAHFEFAQIQVEPPAIFHFDERLFEKF